MFFPPVDVYPDRVTFDASSRGTFSARNPMHNVRMAGDYSGATLDNLNRAAQSWRYSILVICHVARVDTGSANRRFM